MEKNTHRILDLVDSVTHDPSAERAESPGNPVRPCKATFFVLGWIAERLPNLVREIHARGHEVASHGYDHNLCRQEDLHSLEQDLKRSKKLLEDIIGGPVRGYRAPSFSVDPEVLKVIEDCGYLYDSSFNSFALHDRYGELELGDCPKHGIAARVSEGFFELPVSNLEKGRLILPWGGGGYFRLMPFLLFKWGVRSILRNRGGFVFYLHPWEVDPDQPRVRNASRMYRFRHYVNLRGSVEKLGRLIGSFTECRFVTCEGYLKDVIHSSLA